MVDTTADTWQNRIVGEGVVAPSDLVPNPKNWRFHPTMQAEGLVALLDSVGWVQRVIVNKRTGRIVDGHLRVAQALRRGTDVPVAYVDLREDEEDLVLATLDPLGALAESNASVLSEILAGLGELPDGLDALRVDIDELFGTAMGTLPEQATDAFHLPNQYEGTTVATFQARLPIHLRDTLQERAERQEITLDAYVTKLVCRAAKLPLEEPEHVGAA